MRVNRPSADTAPGLARSNSHSLFGRRIRTWAWVLFALLGVLPLLSIIRLGMMLWLPVADSAALLQMTVLGVFTLCSLLAGLAILHRVVRRVETAWQESVMAVSALETHSQSRSVSTTGEALAQPTARGLPDTASNGNELDSVAQALRQLQATVATSFARMDDQTEHLRNLEFGLLRTMDRVLVLDSDNNLTYCNKAAIEGLGLVCDRNIHRALAESNLPAATWLSLTERIEPWIDREEEFSLSLGPNGAVAYYLSVSVRFDAEGRRWKIVVVRDMSEYRRLERQLYRSERLAALGQLISGVAHELNNPLAAILGFSELCRDASLPREDLVHHLEVIDREAKRTHQIVRDLLTFSRQRQTAKAFTDVHELLERCLSLLGYQFKVQGITVDRHYAENLPLLNLDEHHIQQVFMNLMINAAQAMGEATVSDPRIALTTELADDGQNVQIQITDNGPGVPAEYAEQIFAPFFTTKSEGDGTGLGLPVSQTIVSKHGGELTLQNVPDGGASFTITLPVPSEKDLLNARDRVQKVRQAEIGGQIEGHVLLVDDEFSVLELGRHALEQIGLEVTTAATFREASRWLGSIRFSAAVCDVRLPDGDGIELWRLIADNYPELARSTVFITGDPRGVQDLQKQVGQEIPVILKPFRLSEFREKIRSLIEGGE